MSFTEPTTAPKSSGCSCGLSALDQRQKEPAATAARGQMVALTDLPKSASRAGEDSKHGARPLRPGKYWSDHIDVSPPRRYWALAVVLAPDVISNHTPGRYPPCTVAPAEVTDPSRYSDDGRATTERWPVAATWALKVVVPDEIQSLVTVRNEYVCWGWVVVVMVVVVVVVVVGGHAASQSYHAHGKTVQFWGSSRACVSVPGAGL